jgi:transposase
MRFGFERPGGLLREKMQAEPSRELFVFVSKRGHTMKMLSWDSTGVMLVHKRLDAGKFELPKPTRAGDQHVVVNDPIFEAIYKGVSVTPRAPRGRVH